MLLAQVPPGLHAIHVHYKIKHFLVWFSSHKHAEGNILCFNFQTKF